MQMDKDVLEAILGSFYKILEDIAEIKDVVIRSEHLYNMQKTVQEPVVSSVAGLDKTNNKQEQVEQYNLDFEKTFYNTYYEPANFLNNDGSQKQMGNRKARINKQLDLNDNTNGFCRTLDKTVIRIPNTYTTTNKHSNEVPKKKYTKKAIQPKEFNKDGYIREPKLCYNQEHIATRTARNNNACENNQPAPYLSPLKKTETISDKILCTPLKSSPQSISNCNKNKAASEVKNIKNYKLTFDPELGRDEECFFTQGSQHSKLTEETIKDRKLPKKHRILSSITQFHDPKKNADKDFLFFSILEKEVEDAL